MDAEPSIASFGKSKLIGGGPINANTFPIEMSMRAVLTGVLLVALSSGSEPKQTPSASAPRSTLGKTPSHEQLPTNGKPQSEDEMAKAREALDVFKTQDSFGSDSWTPGLSAKHGFSFEFPGDYNER